MGKYMKKSKPTCEISVTELSHQSIGGVRTRAKTLALQQQQQQQTLVSNVSKPPICDDGTWYLQLRSRRLEKSPNQHDLKDGCAKKLNPSSRLGRNLVNLDSVLHVDECFDGVRYEKGETEAFDDLGVGDEDEDYSFGENNLEFEGRERSTRESTPCSFIRDSDKIHTPGSTTTRPTSSTPTNQRARNAIQRNNPYTWEIDEFFACAEQQQQMLLANKYNFDFANEMPLRGHYDWVSVNP